MTIRSALLAAALVAAAPALAAGPLQVTSTVMVQAKQRAADGTTRVALVAPTRVTPGDRVVYTIAYRNTGSQPLAGVVIANPLPKDLAYRAAAAGTPTPEVSTDGVTFGSLGTLTVRTPTGQRTATVDDVTHLRWRLATPLTAGAQGQFAFEAVVK
jgi:uncharacterized repeat protein (TIGR01451 family)